MMKHFLFLNKWKEKNNVTHYETSLDIIEKHKTKITN